MEGLDLCLLSDLANQALGGMVGVMSVPVVEALTAHVLAQVARICCEASDGDAHVVIDVKDLLLVRGQVVGALLQRDEDLNDYWLTYAQGVREGKDIKVVLQISTYHEIVGLETERGGALLHCFLGVFNLKGRG